MHLFPSLCRGEGEGVVMKGVGELAGQQDNRSGVGLMGGGLDSDFLGGQFCLILKQRGNAACYSKREDSYYFDIKVFSF